MWPTGVIRKSNECWERAPLRFQEVVDLTINFFIEELYEKGLFLSLEFLKVLITLWSALVAVAKKLTLYRRF